MSNIPARIAVPAIGCAILFGFALPAQAQPIALASGSDAYALSASFSHSGMSTEIAPVDEAQGALPPPYNVTKSLAAFNQTIAIPPLIPATGPLPPVAASFTANATGLKSNAASKGIELDFVSTTGKSSVATANLTITNTVPPGSALPILLYLGVTASKVVTSADYTQTFPQTVTVTGAASFGSLSISGSLLNGQTVTYSGSAPPNTVLYKSPVASTNEIPAVTITANAETKVGIISCGPNCVFTPTRINVAGLSVNLYNAMINGFPVTGTIVLGSAAAQ